ncbi:MAG: biotin carboxylase, partial [Candidatus Margulisiibacteriota bacterium]
MTKPITVAVTGLNAVDSPGPGISVIRSLLESTRYSVKIIGLAYESMEPGIYMKELVHKTYHIPYPSSGSENLLERLRYIHDREKIDVLIPNFDAELLSFIKLESPLRHMGIAMCLPNEKQFESRQKANLVQFGHDHGVDVPYSSSLYAVKDIVKTLASFSFPVIVKGQYYEAFVARTLEETIAYFKTIQKKW